MTPSDSLTPEQREALQLVVGLALDRLDTGNKRVLERAFAAGLAFREASPSPQGDLTCAEMETRLLNTENPLTQALDILYGEGEWSEAQADALCNAFLGAIVQAREDRQAGISHPREASPSGGEGDR